MSKSKCTCQHRHPSVNVRAWNFTHEESCYYSQKLREERQARGEREEARRLSSHYSREARKAHP